MGQITADDEDLIQQARARLTGADVHDLTKSLWCSYRDRAPQLGGAPVFRCRRPPTALTGSGAGSTLELSSPSMLG